MSYSPQGRLMRDTCMDQLAQAKAAILQGARDIDLSELERVDSTALAFWLALKRWSDAQDIELRWQGFPTQMLSMAELVGIESFLGH